MLQAGLGQPNRMLRPHTQPYQHFRVTANNRILAKPLGGLDRAPSRICMRIHAP
jgi:hypothetical protein